MVYSSWFIVLTKTHERKLKKQSQFFGGQIDVKSYLKGYYDKILLCGARKNKANSNLIVSSDN